MKRRIASLLAVFSVCLAAHASNDAVGLSSSNDWQTIDYTAGGTVTWEENTLIIGQGEMLTGVVTTQEVPTMNYEISLEARRTMGGDFFCGLTFPIATNHCTIVMGGWGGTVLGMSSVDGLDASENSTSTFFDFKDNQWYTLRVRVTPGKISAWVDDKAFMDGFETEGHRLHMRYGEIEKSAPLGISTWQSRGEIRNIRITRLPEQGKE